ncbi:MAG: hypothetical protein FJX11_12430 [Alphaproteobacteria bacterium]|nr:hypothetical protein [Alphaproteobacteria bacterium]
MLLIRRSARAANAVRNMSPGEELFVASVVFCMLLAAFGDAGNPTVLDALGFEFLIADLGGEMSLLAVGHWHLIEFLLGGAILAGVITALQILAAAFLRSLSPAASRGIDKVPIQP